MPLPKRLAPLVLQQGVFCCEVSQLKLGKLGITHTAKYLDTGQFEKILNIEI